MFAFIMLLLLPLTTFANEPCPRPAPGSAVTPPPDLWSENGVLNVTFNYFTTVDSDGPHPVCIAQFQPAVAGLRQRVLIVRDQNVEGNPAPGGLVPSWDLTLNHVPIPYRATPHAGYVPSVIRMERGEREFWRVLNASADTILDLALLYDHVAQPLKIVGLDGVPVGSQDGTRRGLTLTQSHILLPPAGRAEFIVTAPPTRVKDAVFQTRTIDTGPAGDNDPARPPAVIKTVSRHRYAVAEGTSDSQPWALPLAEDVTDVVPGDRFAGAGWKLRANHAQTHTRPPHA